MHTPKLLSIAITLALLTACEGVDGTTSSVCPADLRASIDRASVTLRRADSTRLQATALGCGGTVTLATSWVWTATDTSVVRVNASTGWVYGVRAGVSDVIGTSGSPYSVVVRSVVTVTP